MFDVKAGSGVYGGKEPLQRPLRLPWYSQVTAIWLHQLIKSLPCSCEVAVAKEDQIHSEII